MPVNLSEWLSLLTLTVLVLTLVAVVWYSWETRGMKQEMQRSRHLTADQLALVREDYERRYDAHVTVTGWDQTLAELTLANAGPGPAVEVAVRVRVLDQPRQAEECYVGSSGSVPVGANVSVLLSRDLQPADDFPESAGTRLTVEIITTTGLGHQMAPKVLHPVIRD